MNFDDDFLCAPKVKSGYLEEAGDTVHWLNGSAANHSSLMTMLSKSGKQQEAYQKAVYGLAANPDGSFRYFDKMDFNEFKARIDHTAVRNWALMILGITKSEDGPMDFDEEVKDTVKKSVKAKGDSSS